MGFQILYCIRFIESFLSNRFQKVLLNGQTSEWLPIKACVQQGSILGTPFPLIYIYDLPDNLQPTVKLFTDDKSLSSVVNDDNILGNELNKDLQKYMSEFMSAKCLSIPICIDKLRK